MRIVERRVGDVTILQLIGRLELDDGDTLLRDTVERPGRRRAASSWCST